MRVSKAIRGLAWTAVIGGAAAPLIRRKVTLPKPLVLGAAAAAPAALCIARPKTPGRDIAVAALQMWAYLTAYEMPNDDPEALMERVHVQYPITLDRIGGLGKIPTQRLQKWFVKPGEFQVYERVFVWSHWIWFTVPHATLLYVWFKRREKMTSAAARMYAVFDFGAVIYWLAPTAPPWWAAEHGALGDGDEPGKPPIRRLMLEYGEVFWGRRWKDLFGFLGGNPVAAMPSLHFGTSLMAARILNEMGPISGAIGWTYASTLGVGLVYMGEHYVIDLIAGAALQQAVQVASKPAAPLARSFANQLDALRKLAEAR